jgi:hypothetical protein
MFVYLSCCQEYLREALEPEFFDETEASEETSVRMLKKSDFYELTTTLSRIIQNARLFISAGASPLMRKRRNNRD